jgi:hypothetical protein
VTGNDQVRVGVALVRIVIAYVVFAASLSYAYFLMFLGFRTYDDEGYIMASVRTFLDGLPLYDATFTQYGPFYYVCMGLFYRVSGLPVGHDVTRLVTLAIWIGTAGLLGAFVFRVTRSLGLALFTYAHSVIHGTALIGEPGHPQGLLILLLAVLLMCTTGGGRLASVAPLAMGVICGCLVMTKINIGVFASASAAIALLSLAPASRPWRAALGVSALGFTLLPFAIMRADLSTWAGPHAIISACAIAAACAAAWRMPIADPAARPVARFAFAAAATVLLIAALTIAMRTTPKGLVEGVVLTPLRLSSVFTLPWKLPEHAVWYGIGSVAVALVAALAPPGSPALRYAGAVLRIVFAALAVRSTVLGAPVMATIVPLVWVLLLAGDETPASWNHALPRALLALLAAGQLLVAYPVAGAQQACATLLLGPAAAIALADGVALLPPFRLASIRVASEVAVLAGTLLWFHHRDPTPALRHLYRSRPSLELPHADRIRLDPEQGATYRAVAAAIRADCSTFVTMPGLGSFYFWAEQPPLTGFNATAWMTLLDDRTQQRVVERLAAQPLACVLYHEGLTRRWVGSRPIDDRPLVRYIHRAFHPVRTIGDYQLLVRNDR